MNPNSIFEGLGGMFGRSRKKTATKTDEIAEEVRRIRHEQYMRDKARWQEAANKYFERAQSRSGQSKTGTYGKIYGSNPLEWKQTIPQPKKQFRLSKLKWKRQFNVQDVIVVDGREVSGQDLLFLYVKGLFEVTITPKDFDISLFRKRS